MRPRMGARSLGALLVMAAFALGVAPGIAAADNGETLTRFKLPDRAALDTLNSLGADLVEEVIPGENGSLFVTAQVTPEEKAIFQAMGYEPVQTLSDDTTVVILKVGN